MEQMYPDEFSTRFDFLDAQTKWQGRLARVIAMFFKRKLDRSTRGTIENLGPVGSVAMEMGLLSVFTFIDDLLRHAPEYIESRINSYRSVIDVQILDQPRIDRRSVTQLGRLLSEMSPTEKSDFRRQVLNAAADEFFRVMSATPEGREVISGFRSNPRTIGQFFRDQMKNASEYLQDINDRLSRRAAEIEAARKKLERWPMRRRQ